MITRRREAWLLAAAVAVFFYRPLTTGTFFFRDLYQLFYPKKLLLVAAIRSHELPLWDPFIHAGQPYLATPSNAFFQPANILYLFLPPIWAFNLAIVVHFLLCAVGAWWLARTLGLSPAAAFTCGVVYAFCGYTLSAANLLLIFSLPAFPFALAFLERRNLIGASCAIAWPLLSGGAEAAGMLIVTVMAWAIATNPRRAARPAVLAIVFGIALALIQLVPAMEVIRNSSRAARRTYEGFTAWSVDPRRLPELVVPGFLGDTSKLDDRAYWGAELETARFPYMLSIYFGALTLMLATFGAFAKRDEIPRRTLFAIAVLGIVLSLGKFLPFFKLLYEMPFVSTFRFPVKAILISCLPIAVLAGAGLDAATGFSPSNDALKRVATSAAALFTILALFANPFGRAYFGRPVQLAVPLWHVAIVLIVARLVIKRADLLAAVVLLDLAVAGFTVNAFAPRSIFAEPPIAPRIRALVGPGHFYRAPDVEDLQLRAPSDDIMWLARWKIETLGGYTAATFGIPVVFSGDYDGLAPRAMSHLNDVVDRAPWPKRLEILRAFGVRAFIAPDVVDGVVRVATLKTAEAHPLYVYAIPDAQPATFHGPCKGTVALVHRTFNTSEWSVDAPCPGSISFAETQYPGWKQTEIDHTIVRRYEPRLPLIGAILSLVALIALIAVSRAGSAAPP